MKRINPIAWGIAGLLVALAAVVRIGAFEGLLPLPPNAAPMVGVALLAGVVLRSRALAIAVPLTAMAMSDAWIGTYNLPVMMTVYAALLVPVVLSRVVLVRDKLNLARLGGSTLASSLVFFVSTNLAVWTFGGWYDHTWLGLTECFVAALPFLKYAVVGDLMWTSILFGIHAAATQSARQPGAVGRFSKPMAMGVAAAAVRDQ